MNNYNDVSTYVKKVEIFTPDENGNTGDISVIIQEEIINGANVNQNMKIATKYNDEHNIFFYLSVSGIEIEKSV